MRMQFFIYHRDLRKPNCRPFGERAGYVVWTTCVRSLLIGQALIENQSDEFFADQEALQFLTEIVCGLRSPVLGETEVHGQYKQLLELAEKTSDRGLFTKLMAVHFLARKIRQQHLQGLGAQSYGSFVRKRLSEHKQVAIIGGGQLASEIIPWLAKGNKTVSILVRDPNKHEGAFQNFKNIRFQSLETSVKASALVVAAPVESKHISKVFDSVESMPLVTVDLRAESRHDPLGERFNAVPLDHVFKEIESNRLNTSEKVQSALRLIAESVLDLDGVIGRQLASFKVS